MSAAVDRALGACLDASSCEIALLDGQGTILTVNESWRSFGESSGSPLSDHGVGLSYLAVCEDFEPARAIGQGLRSIIDREITIFCARYPCPGPDGIKIFELEATPYDDPEGTIAAMIRHRDVTTQAEAEEQLERALHGADLGLWDLDLEKDRRRIDARAAEILGFRPEEVDERRSFLEERLHSDDRVVAKLTLERHARGELPMIDNELRIRAKDGRWRWVLERGRIIERDSAGAPLRATGTYLDITVRKRMEEDLQRAIRLEALGTLAGGIAHDFNNLLGAIVSNVAVLEDALSEDFSEIEALADIHAAAERGRQVVRRILDFSRSSADQGSEEVLDLRRVIEEGARILRATAPASVNVRVSVGNDELPIWGQPSEVHRIVVNLCTNAWHALEGLPGHVDIRLDEEIAEATGPGSDGRHPHRRYARISITDDGVGMEPETIDRLFDPFFSTKEAGLGTGLGLSVVHSIVQRLGGTIRVSSEPGVGSTFEVLLPIVPRSSADRTPAQGLSKRRGRGEHVLFVDDDRALARGCSRLLRRLGYSVTRVADPGEALRLFSTDPSTVQVIFTDQRMPGMSGIELAKKARALEPGIPIVLASGYVTEELEEEALACGIRRVLSKPMSPADIAESLAEIFEG